MEAEKGCAFNYVFNAVISRSQVNLSCSLIISLLPYWSKYTFFFTGNMSEKVGLSYIQVSDNYMFTTSDILFEKIK